ILVTTTFFQNLLSRAPRVRAVAALDISLTEPWSSVAGLSLNPETGISVGPVSPSPGLALLHGKIAVDVVVARSHPRGADGTEHRRLDVVWDAVQPLRHRRLAAVDVGVGVVSPHARHVRVDEVARFLLEYHARVRSPGHRVDEFIHVDQHHPVGLRTLYGGVDPVLLVLVVELAVGALLGEEREPVYPRLVVEHEERQQELFPIVGCDKLDGHTFLRSITSSLDTKASSTSLRPRMTCSSKSRQNST